MNLYFANAPVPRSYHWQGWYPRAGICCDNHDLENGEALPAFVQGMLKRGASRDDDLAVPSESFRGGLELPPPDGEPVVSPRPDEGSHPVVRGRTWKVLTLSLLQTAGAVGMVYVAILLHMGIVRSALPQPAMLGILVVVFAAAAAAPISIHYRGDTYLYSLGEVPLLIGLVFLSPLMLVVARAGGQALGLGVVRRQAPLKLLFNVSMGACAAASAALVYHAALGHHGAVTPLGAMVGAAALAAAAVVAQLSVDVVVRLNSRRVPKKTRFEYTTAILSFVASAALALVVLNAAWYEPWAAVPLVLVGALILSAYRGYSRLTQRFSALQRLYDFSDSLARANLEPTATSRAVLDQVQAVMRARRAEVILVEPSGASRRVALRRGELSAADSGPLSPSSLLVEAIASGSSVLLSGSPVGSNTQLQSDPILGEFRDALISPLRSADRTIGVLVALDRDEPLDSFDADDLRLFETLAAHAVSSLERARLVEELRYEAESKLYQATHDLLTKLPNRALFTTSATAALERTGVAAVALLDIDRFKDVNDTLGHDTGDRLLCEVAERLVQAARGRATVARLGGDEFALVVPDIIGPEEAVGIVRDLDVSLSRPFNIDGLTLAVTASAGIALAPDHGDNVAALLQRADIAMYLAKDRRSGIELYSPSRDQSVQRRLMLGGQLLHALEDNNQLSVMYQPIADLSSGGVLRVEALARWEHPVHGWVPATEFISIAEQMGLVDQVTEFVLREALSHASEWRRRGLQVGLAVNLSGRELANEGLVDFVASQLARYAFPASALTLELTETEVMADLGEASAVLGRLARLGVRIAVDDYGTGYSSLAYLHRLPVQELKIDRSFVTNLEDDASNRIIVRSSIAMAHSLGLTVVAEGAEDEVTCAILADAGCDSVQGYFLSRPRPADDLQEWLEAGARLSYSREIPPLRPLRVLEGQPPEHEERGRHGSASS